MKSTWETRKPYNGATRSLVIALDVGTTFSGVSYAILEPGEVPKIHGVTRFPGQEHVAGNSKIPTIMYYDKHGSMVAAGAEAEGGSMAAQAEDEGWTKAELFKLRLRPKSMKLEMNGMRLGHLPRGKTAVDLFGDFLGYLFRCTRIFIVDTHANGPSLWKAVERDIQFVLSHPNGWEGSQQSKMRRAAIRAGLIPDTDEGKARVRFVTEGEASLHACVLNGLAADVLSNPSGHGFLVADAGGGTLDISSYAMRGVSPLVIEEIAPSDCIFAGSVFVGRRARAFFEEKLKGSRYGTPDSLDHIAKRFDETTKRLFRNTKETQFVHFGSPLDKDAAVGIRAGQLKLTGDEVANLFEPSIQAAVSSIISQIEISKGVVKSVWLVGGFAASPWLFNQLQDRLEPLSVTVSRPDSQTSKAVADGAIGFYCDHHVSARMSKHSYGVEFLREYDAEDEDHKARQHRLFELPSGPKLLPDAFDCILSRGIKVKESTTFSRKYCTELTSLSTLSVFEVEIWCYRGMEDAPKWILRNKEEFSTLCFVRADLSPLSGSAQSKIGKGGKAYWTIVFSIEIHFGLTEFKARIKWNDNGKVRYGPASIVYNENGTREEDQEPDNLTEDLNSLSFQHSKPPSRVPSMTGTPRNRSPSRGAEASTPIVSNGIPRSIPAASPTLSPAPVVEERKKSSSSRGISIQSHGSASTSYHASPLSASPKVQSSPTVAYDPPIATSRGISPVIAPDLAQTALGLVESTSTYVLGSTTSKHGSPSRNTPTHSRSTSIPRAATSTSNVVFPAAPTPPAVESRKSSPSRNSHIIAEPLPPAIIGSRRVSFSSRHGHNDPATAATHPVVEPSKPASPSRSGLGTPTAANSTAQPPTASVAPPASAPSPPVVNVTEPSSRKSRKASAIPSLIPSPTEKSKSKASTPSDSTGLTYATATPVVRSTKSSMSRSDQTPIGETLNVTWGLSKSATATPTPVVRSTKSSMSRSDQTPIGETLNGTWGPSKSATASTTASPWKASRPLDPPPAAVVQIREGLLNGFSSPPIVGDSQKPLETIMEPPVDPISISPTTKPGDVAALGNGLEVQFKNLQEPAPEQVQVEQLQSVVEQPPYASDPEPVANVAQEPASDKDISSKIPGGLDVALDNNNVIQQEQSPKAPAIAEPKKKGSKKKKTESKAASAVVTPIETTPSTPWSSQKDPNVDDKNANLTVQPVSVPPAPIEPQPSAIDQVFDTNLTTGSEEKTDIWNHVLDSEPEAQPASNAENQETSGEIPTTTPAELPGGALSPIFSQPLTTEPIVAPVNMTSNKASSKIGTPVRSTGATTPWGPKKSGTTTPSAWGTGPSNPAPDQSATGSGNLWGMGSDWFGTTVNAVTSKFVAPASGSSDNKSPKEVPAKPSPETPIDWPVAQQAESGVDGLGQVEEQIQAEAQKSEDGAKEVEQTPHIATEEAAQGDVAVGESVTEVSKRASQVGTSAEPMMDQSAEWVEGSGDAENQNEVQIPEQNVTTEDNEQEMVKQEEAAKITEEVDMAEEPTEGIGWEDTKKKKGKKEKGKLKGQTQGSSPHGGGNVLEDSGAAIDDENAGQEETPKVEVQTENEWPSTKGSKKKKGKKK